MDQTSFKQITACPVLYSDEHLIIIDKPSGVLSHPNPKQNSSDAQPSAFEGKYNFESRAFQTPAKTVYLIHRLDQDTSGVLLAARDTETAQKLRLAFEEGRVQKSYFALVSGSLPQKGSWNDYVEVKKEYGRVRSIVKRSTKPNAKLTYSVHQYFGRYRLSLLDIRLLTGKTHQIRVQSASRGNPVCGDEIYGDFSFNKKLRREIDLRRIFLHAARLDFTHPLTQEKLKIEALLPEKLKNCLAKLG